MILFFYGDCPNRTDTIFLTSLHLELDWDFSKIWNSLGLGYTIFSYKNDAMWLLACKAIGSGTFSHKIAVATALITETNFSFSLWWRTVISMVFRVFWIIVGGEWLAIWGCELFGRIIDHNSRRSRMGSLVGEKYRLLDRDWWLD